MHNNGSYICTFYEILTGDDEIKQECNWYGSYDKLYIVMINREENRKFRVSHFRCGSVIRVDNEQSFSV